MERVDWLEHGIDAGFLSGAPHSHENDSGESDNSPSHSGENSTRLTGLAASLRALSESLLRGERAEAEMAKAREALRLRLENQRAEAEAELTRLMIATELEIASLVSCRSRKRKMRPVEDDEDRPTTQQVSQRERYLLSTLLQCNLLL